jgi:hypothetical protein
MTDSANISDDEIVSSGPTEAEDDNDAGGEGSKDTGDEPTEAEDDKDTGGEGSKDTGDEA